jgi:hypothetical protein
MVKNLLLKLLPLLEGKQLDYLPVETGDIELAVVAFFFDLMLEIGRHFEAAFVIQSG